MKKKKWLAMLIAVAMVCMMLPMSALAAGIVPDSIAITVSGYEIGQPMADADITTTTEGITVTPVKDWMSWIDGEYSNASGNFERGIRYCHYVNLKAKDGYTLPEISNANIKSILTVNGKAPTTAWDMGTEADGSRMIFFFTEELVEKTDNAFTLTVSNYAVGNTWDGSNVSASSDKIQVGTAHLVYDEVIDNHDVVVTGPLEAHTAYRFYFYISTNTGYIFDVDYLVANKENVSIVVNGQTVTPWRIGDGGTDGKSISMDIDAPMLHNYGKYQYDETKHWQECQDADCPDKEGSIQHSTANHSFGDWTEVKAPTETQEGIKERACVCGYKESETIPVAGHNPVKTEATDATCTQDGNSAYWYCEGCGKYFSDEDCTTEIALADTVIKAVHSYADGKCTVCGAADPNYVPTEPTPNPTPTPVPTDKPNTEVPKTGDNSNMMLWGMLLLAAGAGIASVVLYGRKRAAKH